MNAKRKFLWVLVLASATLVVGPSLAAAADLTLYELTEDMSLFTATGVPIFDNTTPPTFRDATSALQGSARAGTPICPAILLQLLGSTATSCAVNGMGQDHVNITMATVGTLGPGAGTLSGDLEVILNADNVVDPPEFVVMTGHFEGTVQLLGSVPIGNGKKVSLGPSIQLILMNGTFTPTKIVGLDPAALAAFLTGQPSPALLGLGTSSFSGVFRLPFKIGKAGNPEKAERGKQAFYLGPNGELVKVQEDELALGFPTVRAEVTFGP